MIDAFWQKGLGEPENACFEGVQYWKKGGCKPVNWNTVLQALDKGAGMKEYATDLELILLSEVRANASFCQCNSLRRDLASLEY